MYHASHLFPIIQAAIFSAFLFTNFRILIKLYTLEKIFFILLQNWNELITPHPLITALPFHKFVYKYARDPHLNKKKKKLTTLQSIANFPLAISFEASGNCLIVFSFFSFQFFLSSVFFCSHLICSATPTHLLHPI